jgi:hypothetical protein
MAKQNITLAFEIVVNQPTNTIVGSIGSQSFRGAGFIDGRYLNTRANLRFNEERDEINIVKRITVAYPQNNNFTQT